MPPWFCEFLIAVKAPASQFDAPPAPIILIRASAPCRSNRPPSLTKGGYLAASPGLSGPPCADIIANSISDKLQFDSNADGHANSDQMLTIRLKSLFGRVCDESRRSTGSRLNASTAHRPERYLLCPLSFFRRACVRTCCSCSRLR